MYRSPDPRRVSRNLRGRGNATKRAARETKGQERTVRFAATAKQRAQKGGIRTLTRS
jgi:hypothetical protein